MKRRQMALLLATAWGMLALPASAVDGVSVTTHWSGEDALAFGGFGEIWRHDIQDSRVVDHVLLYFDEELPARAPVFNPDGTQVAFILRDGSLAVVSVDGGEPQVLASASTTGQAFLDWPVSDWIYYAKGGLFQATASRYLHRVDPNRDQDERVLTFKKDDGATDSGVWRVRVAGDLRHALVRTDDNSPEPWGRIVALDLMGDDGILRLDRSTDRFSCSEGLSPDGQLFIDGHQDHLGIDLRRWDDLSLVESLRWTDIAPWGPDPGDLGNAHNLNNWSANSADWIAIHLGWVPTVGKVRGGNQLLVSWKTQERLVTTQNAEGSFEFDCSGDFFVTSEAGLDTTAPSIVAIKAARQNDQVILSFSENVDKLSAGSAATYAIEPQIDVLSASLSAKDQSTLEVSPLSEGILYTLRLLAGIADRAVPPNVLPAGTEMGFEFFSGQGPLEVDAGGGAEVTLGESVYLAGSASRGGLPVENAEIAWELATGPGVVAFESPSSLATFASLEAVGVYTIRLTARHETEVAIGQTEVVVRPMPTLTPLHPVEGGVLDGCGLAFVEWTSQGVDDVTLLVSTNNAATWEMVALTVDTTSPYWGRYPWLVPGLVAPAALLQLEEYSQVTSALAGPFAIESCTVDLAFTSPQPFARLEAGSTVPIAVDGASGPVRIELSLDGGRSFTPVAEARPDFEGQAAAAVVLPLAQTQWAVLRATDRNNATSTMSGVFSIAPAVGSAQGSPLEQISVVFSLPKRDGLVELRVDGEPVNEVLEQTVVVDLSWPVGIETYVFEVRGQTAAQMFRRLVTATVE